MSASPSSAMPHLRPARRFLAFFALLAAVATGVLPSLRAFPPAPFYTIYGIVRDQVGATLTAQGADLVLLRDNVEIARTRILSEVRGQLNYELPISIDASRANSPRVYAHKAVAAQGVYSLHVEMNGQKFYPIEVAGTLRAGHGGERVRLDLTLGADKNNDGLPDAWQEWVLYQAGRAPGTPGWDINLVTKTGDFDGDGITNYDEYLAGTFAGDATERFELNLVGKTETAVAFEFYAITGKVYTIEESADLRTWTTAAFSTTPTGSTAKSFVAPAIGVQPGYVAVTPGVARFYRLTVR